MTTREFPRSQKIGAAWTIVYALLTLLVGAPLALARSLWLTYRSPPSAVGQQ
jgi:hypothetical protein